MEKEDIVFDPTDLQIDSYGKFSIGDIDVAELTNEQSVKMLIYQHLLNLHELKSTKRELIECKKQVDKLKDEREELRIKLASSASSLGADIASIFVSFLGGFAINMLTSNWSSGLGWAIFLLCISIVLSFKFHSIASVFDS
ncbi:hypothetical protein [Desulfobulbus propionicus]